MQHYHSPIQVYVKLSDLVYKPDIKMEFHLKEIQESLYFAYPPETLSFAVSNNFTIPFNQEFTIFSSPLLHVCIHPCPLLLQKSELSTIKSLTHESAGDHLGATFLKQFTTHRQALRFLAGVYNVDRSLKFAACRCFLLVVTPSFCSSGCEPLVACRSHSSVLSFGWMGSVGIQ